LGRQSRYLMRHLRNASQLARTESGVCLQDMAFYLTSVPKHSGLIRQNRAPALGPFRIFACINSPLACAVKTPKAKRGEKMFMHLRGKD
jgi:hypothetical protein